MEYTTVRYGRTINLGNYESAKIEVEAQIEFGDTLENVLHRMQTYVIGFESRVKAGDDTLPTDASVANAEVKRTAKGAAKRAAAGAPQPTATEAPAATRQPAGRATGAKAQPAQATQAESGSKVLWKKADWESLVDDLDSAGVLNTFKSEMSDTELYANIEAWKTCCEAFADQARRVIGPTDAERTEMVALLQAEKQRINNPVPVKKPRAKRQPKTS